MKNQNEIEKEIKRHKLNIERTNIDIKKEAHQRMVELLEAELKGFISGTQSKQKDVLKIINNFKGEEYTDKEIWEEIKLNIIKRIEQK